MPHMESPPPKTQQPSSSSLSSNPQPKSISPQIRIKNRRKLYLDRNPSYFTSPDLELLDPLLYDRCIRRFQTPAEREADGRSKGYSGVLEADLYRSEAKLAALKTTSELQDQSQYPAASSTLQPQAPFVSYVRGRDGEVLPEDEDEVPSTKEEGLERWKFEMTIRFLRGDDPDFEYGKVDESEDYDDVEREEEEERWFEEEDPEWERTPRESETGIQDF